MKREKVIGETVVLIDKDAIHEAWVSVRDALDIQSMPPVAQEALYQVFFLGADMMYDTLLTVPPALRGEPDYVRRISKSMQIDLLREELRGFWASRLDGLAARIAANLGKRKREAEEKVNVH